MSWWAAWLMQWYIGWRNGLAAEFGRSRLSPIAGCLPHSTGSLKVRKQLVTKLFRMSPAGTRGASGAYRHLKITSQPMTMLLLVSESAPASTSTQPILAHLPPQQTRSQWISNINFHAFDLHLASNGILHSAAVEARRPSGSPRRQPK